MSAQASTVFGDRLWQVVVWAWVIARRDRQSWLMPMSWAVSALGVGAFLFNLVVAGITFQRWDAAKIDKLAIDWKTGSIIMVGGLIRNGTAFNLGHFVFIDPGYVVAGDPEKSYDALVAHETGHTLAVAAFGSAFTCTILSARISSVPASATTVRRSPRAMRTGQATRRFRCGAKPRGHCCAVGRVRGLVVIPAGGLGVRLHHNDPSLTVVAREGCVSFRAC
jgi:hypothetical protein